MSTAASRSTAELKPTGINGLDTVLRGGLPSRRLFLVQGQPGSGKTTLALQFLLEGVRRGEGCLYVTLSESEEEIQGVAASHGWSLDGIVIYDLSLVEHQLREGEENSLFHPGEVELQETTQPVLEQIASQRPVRVVFDSLSELRMLAVHPLRYRRRILSLKQHLAKHGCTTLFLDDGTSDPKGDLQLQSLAHGVIELEQRAPAYGKERRQLRVLKMRGVNIAGGHHDFAIEKGGAVVYPRLTASEHHSEFKPEAVSSGLAPLDALVGGGLARGTSTLLIGPAGAGKSLLMSLYAFAAAERGERAAIFAFEESLKSFVTRSRGLGLDADRHLDSGRLTFQQINPAELSPSEFAHLVRQTVEEDGARVIGIDSLNGYLNAMPAEKALALQMHELLTYLNQQGATTFLVMAQHGLVGSTMNSPVDVSYIADNVLMLRYFEAGGRVRKALSVVKKRSGPHESAIRELLLTPGQIEVGPSLDEFSGVLTGVPSYQGSAKRLLQEDP